MSKDKQVVPRKPNAGSNTIKSITNPNASKNNVPQQKGIIPFNNNAESQNNTGFFSYFKSFGSSLFTGISSITSSFLNVFSWPKDKIFSLFVKITNAQNSNSSTENDPSEKKEEKSTKDDTEKKEEEQNKDSPTENDKEDNTTSNSTEEKNSENNITENNELSQSDSNKQNNISLTEEEQNSDSLTENDPSENNEKKNEITNNTTKEQAIKSTIITRTRSSSFNKNPSPSKQLKKSNSLDDIKSITKEQNSNSSTSNSIGIYTKLKQQIENNLDINKSDLQDENTLHEMAKLGRVYKNLGSAYENLGDENTALQHYKKAKEIFNEIKNTGNSLEQIFGLESIDDLENQSKPTNKEIEEFEIEEAKINNYSEKNPLTNTEDPFKEEEEDNKNIETNLTDTKCEKPEEGVNDDELDLDSYDNKKDDKSDGENDQHKNLEEKIRKECEKFAHNKIINSTPEEFKKLDPQKRSDNLKEWQEQKAKDWQKWSDTERKQFAKDMKKFKFVDLSKFSKQFDELIKQTPTEPHDLEKCVVINGVLFDENVNNSGLSFSEALYYVEHSPDLAGSSFESDNNPDAPNPTLSGDHKHFEENSDSL